MLLYGTKAYRRRYRSTKLSSEELFLRDMLAEPLLNQRLAIARALRSVTASFDCVARGVAILAAATAEVQASSTLRSVLRLTLAIGNHLNAGSSHAAATGFQVR